jgi:hypothetical protein
MGLLIDAFRVIGLSVSEPLFGFGLKPISSLDSSV